MAISEDVTFDSQKLKFESFVDFESNVTVSEHTNQLADHILLFSFRPFMSNWIQPIGVFAARSATPGKVIRELMIKAITTLYQHYSIAKAVVCDGAQTNKQFMSLCGERQTRLNTPLKTPMKNQQIYLFCFVFHTYSSALGTISFNKRDVQVLNCYFFRPNIS